MSALWSRFTGKLKDSGYTLNDLVYCNEDLFLTIAEDMNDFTPLQIASLAKEWQRWMQSAAPAPTRASPQQQQQQQQQQQVTHNSTLSTSPPPNQRDRAGASERFPARSSAAAVDTSSTSRLSPSKSTLSAALRENAFSPPHRSPAKIKEEADYLLMKLGAQSGEEYQVSPTEGLVAVEASPEAWSPLMERVARMHPAARSSPAAAELQLLWKLCSPATLRKMERACVSGAPFGLSNQDDPDGLCSSTVVLYHREATRLSASTQELGELFRAGWALVAFDVAVGRARTVTKDEAQDLNANLYRFSMGQCLEMLEDAGFDAFHIPSRNAVAVCHMHQVMPRFVVYVTTVEPVAVTRRLGEKPSLQNGAGTNATSSAGTHAPPARAPPVPVPTPPPPAASAAAPVVATPAASSALTRRTPDDLHCTVHRVKAVEFWSPTEKRLLCSHCLYYDGYTQENCIPIEQAAREEVPRLERWVLNATTFTQEIQGVFDLVDAAQTDVSQSHDRVRSDIAQSFTRLRARLEALEASLQQQCQQRAQQSHAALQDTTSRVEATLQFVQDVIRDADEPIAAYHGGAADIATCVSLLRTTQRAFGAWEPVSIPSYENVSIVDGGAVLQPVEEALKAVQAVMSEPGKIQLPEAIDVNYLKSDCEV